VIFRIYPRHLVRSPARLINHRKPLRLSSLMKKTAPDYFDALKSLSDQPELFEQERQKLIDSFLASIKDPKTLQELKYLQSEIDARGNKQADMKLMAQKIRQLTKKQVHLVTFLETIFSPKNQ